MVYEYENKINEAFFIAGRDGRNVNIELLVELQQVYNKAKAFDRIRNLDKDFYEEYGYSPNEEEWWYEANNIFEKYEEGT